MPIEKTISPSKHFEELKVYTVYRLAISLINVHINLQTALKSSCKRLSMHNDLGEIISCDILKLIKNGSLSDLNAFSCDQDT